MTAFNKFDQFVQDLASKVHNLDSDTLMVMLSDVLPVRTNKLKADITEIAAGNGYTTGGLATGFTSGVQTSGVYRLILPSPVFTAVGGSIAQFRYVVLYNATPTTPLKPLIGWYDYGAEQNVTSGNSFTIGFDPTNGALTIT